MAAANTHSSCGNWHEIKLMGIPAWIRKGLQSPTLSGGAMGSRWFLSKEEAFFFRDMAALCTSQWVALHPRANGQHELDTVAY